MCDVLSRLPRDVQTIVYRYVFDRNYKRVLMNYRSVWLNDRTVLAEMREDNERCIAFCWCKYGEQFIDFYCGTGMWHIGRIFRVANYRDIHPGVEVHYRVCNFFSKVTGADELPKNW